MSRPDRTVTQARVTVLSEAYSADEMKVDLFERLRAAGYEIEKLEVERVEMTYPEEESNGNQENSEKETEKSSTFNRARAARD